MERFYTLDEPLTQAERDELANGNGPDYVDQTTWRSFRNPRNDWMIDRELQRTDTFTGIAGINSQDRAVQEAMKPIVDRSQEHLGQTDRAVITARKMLMQATRAVEDGGMPSARTTPTTTSAR